ncbi:uncharacterized protein KGF55_001574 [Candida pseudojiufengensis]|uniref:uncharacterized protein n=1 Tax=Candida pseudojiufengensis TaxID=497109 RepID=UPI0022251FD2|nr:uncharacterized protein KGF55_001574 [Candida pseudojiufengensis]KAI5965353.1 hypothetical protein KGF55_001574 [Candida pseudojiufengensis]
MRFNIYSALALLCFFITSITAFSNTAPLIIKSKYNLQKLIPSSEHIIKNSQLESNIPMIYATNNFQEEANLNYPNKIDKTDEIVYFQTSLRDWNQIEDKSLLENENYYSIDNVFYKDDSQVDMIQFEIINVKPEVLDFDSLSQFVSTINQPNSFPKDFILQIIPDFITENNRFEKIEEKIINLFNNEHDKIVVKKHEEEEDESNIKIQQEIESDFAEANKLAAEETQLVSIFEGGGEINEDLSNNATTVKHDNLFTNYQFFTSGIWSGLIVSGFLLSILYAALSWLSALEITYASFEKPVDFDKKNE